MFGTNDPIHMSTLHVTFLTLFRCATLEDWTDVMYIAMEGEGGVLSLLCCLCPVQHVTELHVAAVPLLYSRCRLCKLRL